MIGNPPWDVMKPNSQEFFTDSTRSIAPTTSRRRCGGRQDLFESVSGRGRPVGRVQRPVQGAGQLGQERRRAVRPDAWHGARKGRPWRRLWAKHRQRAQSVMPTPSIRSGSRAVPTSTRTRCSPRSSGTCSSPMAALASSCPRASTPTSARRTCGKTLLNRGRLDLLYAFQNEKRVFAAAHHSLQAGRCLRQQGRHDGVVPRPGSAWAWATRRRPTRLPDDILRNDSAAMVFTPEDVQPEQPEDAEPGRTQEPA